jgi:hypothetical protein
MGQGVEALSVYQTPAALGLGTLENERKPLSNKVFHELHETL